MFSLPVSSGWKPVPTSSKLATRPRSKTRPFVGSVMRLRIFSKRAFAGTVAANDAQDLALLDLEAHILERPKFLDLIPLHDLATTNDVGRLACKVTDFASDDVAQRRVLIFLPEEANRCPIRYRLDRFSTTIAFSDMAANSRSNQVREAFFRLAELTHSEPQEKSDHRNADQQTRRV